MSNHSGSDISNSDDSDSNPPDPESEDESTPTPNSQPTSNPESDLESDSSSDSGSNLDSSSDSNPDNGSDDGATAAGVENGQVVSWQEITETIAKAQRRNIRHDAAEVAKAAVPFENGDEAHAFALALDSVLSFSYPAGFGLTEEYESLESYRTGHSTKTLTIPLPYDVWFPCIVVWCKALDLLKCLSICKIAATEL